MINGSLWEPDTVIFRGSLTFVGAVYILGSLNHFVSVGDNGSIRQAGTVRVDVSLVLPDVAPCMVRSMVVLLSERLAHSAHLLLSLFRVHSYGMVLST